MLIGAVIVVCVVLLVLAFVFPKLSRHPQRGAQRSFGLGGRAAGKAPGKLGSLLAKPFHSSSRAAGRSAGAGRKGRGKMPM